jgi:hypothetical protein
MDMTVSAVLLFIFIWLGYAGFVHKLEDAFGKVERDLKDIREDYDGSTSVSSSLKAKYAAAKAEGFNRPPAFTCFRRTPSPSHRYSYRPSSRPSPLLWTAEWPP